MFCLSQTVYDIFAATAQTDKDNSQTHNSSLWFLLSESIITYSYVLSTNYIDFLFYLCGLLDCNIPGFLVLHYLPELAETHVH